MLSRLALRHAQTLPITAHGAQIIPAAASSTGVPRPVRRIEPAPVRHGFIPEGWFTYFYPKTGVTGPYMFLVGISTYLLSKEIYVLDHEYYNGVSFLIMWIFGIKKLGPKVGAYLSKEQDKIEADLNSGRVESTKVLEESIDHEKTVQWQLDGQKLIMEIKKENIKMQLEATYRERMAQVYNEVKKRLDYQVQIQALERRLAQKQMSQWIINSVIKAITPDLEKATLQQCIKDLEGLAVKA